MTNKPFIFGVAAFGENFTDRAAETARLLANFQHGINTILISPRRWGKTSLVQKVRSLAQTENVTTVYLDIFSCRNETDFYREFTAAVLKQTSSKFQEWMEYAKEFLSGISPRFTLGSNPDTDYSISIDFDSKSKSVEEVLQLPEKIAQKKGIRLVICIDEFQQLSAFSDSLTFQKKLRAVWQNQKLVSYCLFGSKKHLMNELFEKKSLPFYKFGDLVPLGKITTDHWVRYIKERFESTGKEISNTLAEKVCLTVENHSSYVQQLAWLLWIYTETIATEELFNTAINDLIDQNTPLYQKETEELTSYQLNFIKALVDGIQQDFTSQRVLQTYKLGTSANITIMRKALLKKELIDVESKRISLTDPVFKLWFKRNFTT